MPHAATLPAYQERSDAAEGGLGRTGLPFGVLRRAGSIGGRVSCSELLQQLTSVSAVVGTKKLPQHRRSGLF